jgi:hypothetical protein
MTYPPAGARPVNVSVAVVCFPPLTLIGAKVKPRTVGAVTTTGLVRVIPLTDAETFTVVAVCTGRLVKGKVNVVVLAGIVTVAGTVPAAGVSEERAITKPPAGALLLMVTVPVETAPPRTVVGFIVRVVKVGAVIVRGALAEVPRADAEIFAVAFD